MRIMLGVLWPNANERFGEVSTVPKNRVSFCKLKGVSAKFRTLGTVMEKLVR